MPDLPHSDRESDALDHGHPESDTLRELREIWVNTTEDTVTRDLERARELVEGADPEEEDTARGYLEALERLGRWLHDR